MGEVPQVGEGKTVQLRPDVEQAKVPTGAVPSGGLRLEVEGRGPSKEKLIFKVIFLETLIWKLEITMSVVLRQNHFIVSFFLLTVLD